MNHTITHSSRWLTLIICMMVMALGVLFLSAPIAILIDRFMPDDAFYYFKTAQNFVQTGLPTFDGSNLTSGFQPLWFLVSSLIFFFFPQGGELPIRILMLIQIVCIMGTVLCVLRFFKGLFSVSVAYLSTLLFLLLFFRVMMNGLETAILMFLYTYFVFFITQSSSQLSIFMEARQLSKLGTLLGLLFLARVDSIFIVLAVGIIMLVHKRFWKALFNPLERSYMVQHIFAFICPLCLIIGGELLINWFYTGHIFQVSGAVKGFYSALMRHGDIESMGVFITYWKNITWAFRQTEFWFISLSLVGPWSLLLLKFTRFHDHPVVLTAQKLLPLFLGSLTSYLFYAVHFYGGFTKTFWYYGPHTFIGVFFVAALFSLFFDQLSGFLRSRLKSLDFLFIEMLTFLFLIIILLGWCSWIVFIMIMLLLCLTLLSLNLWIKVFVWLGMLGGLAFVANQYHLVINWRIFIVLALLGIWFFCSKLANKKTYSILGLSLLLLVLFPTYYVSLKYDLNQSPFYWNYALYRGALWARDNIPIDATIWAGSAGILGYFSNHRVINTDGLINSYEYFENVLKMGKTQEYNRQWDYTIDAWGVPSGLESAYPGIVKIVLPSELSAISFQDEGKERALQVYKMP